MKLLLVCAFICLVNSLCMAANEIDMNKTSDVFKGKTSDVKISFIGHASIMIENNNKVYHIDPWGNMGNYSKLPKADVIFVTHEHFDHYDAEAIKQISKADTKIITTETVANEFGKKTFVTVLSNGQNTNIGDVKVEAVPAYNIVHKHEAGPFHPKGRGNGYWIILK